MAVKTDSILLFEERKKTLLSFLDQVKGLSLNLDEMGIGSERLKAKIENARNELIKGEFRIGVIGRFRIGKSTFLNVFIGNRVLKERESGGGCTAVVTKVKSGRDAGAKVYYHSSEELYELFISTLRDADIMPDLYQVVVDDIPARDRLDVENFRTNNRNILISEEKKIKEGFSRKTALIEFALYIIDHWETFKGELGKVEEVSKKRYLDISTDRTRAPFIKEIQLTVDFDSILPDNVVLMDTPGLGAANWDENITIKHLKDCHAAIHMLLPPAGFESIDLNLLTDLKQRQPNILDKMVFVVNRSDEISKGAKEKIKKHVEDEIGKIGFSDTPVLFCCSKLPFLLEVKNRGGELSADEAEYVDYTSYRFHLGNGKPSKKKTMDICGFSELQKVVNELLSQGRADSILQQSIDNAKNVCGEIENVFSTHNSMLESGVDGENKFLEKIDEMLAMVEYEKERVDREIYQATSLLTSKVSSWLYPYRNIGPKQTSFFGKFLKYFENPAFYEARKKKKVSLRDFEIKFLGFPIKISAFKEKIDLVTFDIGDYIQEFWSWENYIKRCEDSMNPEETKKVKTFDSALTEKVMDEMRKEFLSELSGHLEKKLKPVLDGVKDDMSNLQKAALEKTRGEITGISENLINELNKILKTSFSPIEVENFTHSVENLSSADTHLTNLGRENGVWEKTMSMAHTVFVNAYSDKVKKQEKIRLGRIRSDVVEHLDVHLFTPLVKEIVSYITRVVKDLKDVMMVEVEMQLEDIKAYALVDKFGNSHEQIKNNIEKAESIKVDIAKVEVVYKEKTLPLYNSINDWGSTPV